jgi:hypothetical protein
MWLDLKKKLRTDGLIKKYKVRSVVQGFGQKEVFDFFDTYAFARITTIPRVTLLI